MSANTAQTILACPVCQAPLRDESPCFRCSKGHSFDRARQGYLNLLMANHKRSRSPGDSAEMIQARQRFLNSGHYAPLSTALNQLVAEHLDTHGTEPAHIADVGCGDGYYTDRLASFLSGTSSEHAPSEHGFPHQYYGIDISRDAIKAACRRSTNIHWLVASGVRLPLLANGLDMIISLFTPVMPESWLHALKPGGKLVLVTTGSDHLRELRERIYTDVVERVFDPTQPLQQAGFSSITTSSVQFRTCVKQQALADLLLMTPHGWRATKDAKRTLLTLPELTITADMNVWVFSTPEADAPATEDSGSAHA